MKDDQSIGEPPVSLQQEFWDEWNTDNRCGGLDPYMLRLQEHATRTASMAVRTKILEIGCGTGWLSRPLAAYGEVLGIDLSPAAIEVARSRSLRGSKYLAGDFLTLPIAERFDFVISADTISHFVDQAAFIARVSELCLPGAHLLLMSQNAFVYHRTSHIQPLGVHHVRRWPTLSQLKLFLKPRFEIIDITSLAPGVGDRGVMKILNGKYVHGIIRRCIGMENINKLYETLLLGRELAIFARRRDV